MANAHQTITFRAVENKEIIGLYQGPAKRAFNYARRANPSADIEIHELNYRQSRKPQ